MRKAGKGLPTPRLGHRHTDGGLELAQIAGTRTVTAYPAAIENPELDRALGTRMTLDLASPIARLAPPELQPDQLGLVGR